MTNRKQNPCCPIDNTQLCESDLFPDNYTRREIQQIRKSCPNAELGCSVSVSPLELDTHILQCTFRRDRIISTNQKDCLFQSAGCPFKGNEPNEVDNHLHNEMATHLNVCIPSINFG